MKEDTQDVKLNLIASGYKLYILTMLIPESLAYIDQL